MRTDFRRGFTLIELLTVIAIIALLVALLFPVFARMRENARKTQCLSNMHAIFVALSQYKLDHGEYPPMLLGYAERSSDRLPWQSGDPGPISASSVTDGFLYPTYIKDISMFHCPDAPIRDQTTAVVATYPGPGAYAGATPKFTRTGKLGFPFPSLPAAYQDIPVPFYGFDSYDVTPIPGGPQGMFQVAYTRDWTG